MSKNKKVIALTGMEKLPACCKQCKLLRLNWDSKYICGALGKYIPKVDRDYEQGKLEDCPLMEVEDETV